MASRAEVVTWLLAGDPSIHWQALRDLTDAPAEAVTAERSRVAEAAALGMAFDVETGVGEASRWNTLRALRALRVLDWSRG